MADVKWIKIVTDIFDDEKMLLIDSLPENDAVIVIWFKLLCLAGKQNNGGVFMLNDKIAYTDEMLATIFRRPLNTVRLALNTFERFGMVEIVNDAITIPKWEKHQNIDELEKMREKTRQRVAEHRNKQKELAMKSNDDECNCYSNVTVTLRNDVDKNRLDKNRLDKNIYTAASSESATKSKRFQKPTLQEIQEYCNERHNNVDAGRFYDYYESNGWKVGKNPMKDWKATVRTWERNEKKSNGGETFARGAATMPFCDPSEYL